ncbi:hypothetical protein, partial [Duncaniella muris]|uniref:hypothetical protein n=1 Tax=Duncaniella muris TaxID=2094150 RepID=UPI00272BC224
EYKDRIGEIVSGITQRRDLPHRVSCSVAGLTFSWIPPADTATDSNILASPGVLIPEGGICPAIFIHSTNCAYHYII